MEDKLDQNELIRQKIIEMGGDVPIDKVLEALKTSGINARREEIEEQLKNAAREKPKVPIGKGGLG